MCRRCAHRLPRRPFVGSEVWQAAVEPSFSSYTQLVAAYTVSDPQEPIIKPLTRQTVKAVVDWPPGNAAAGTLECALPDFRAHRASRSIHRSWTLWIDNDAVQEQLGDRQSWARHGPAITQMRGDPTDPLLTSLARGGTRAPPITDYRESNYENARVFPRNDVTASALEVKKQRSWRRRHGVAYRILYHDALMVPRSRTSCSTDQRRGCPVRLTHRWLGSCLDRKGTLACPLPCDISWPQYGSTADGQFRLMLGRPQPAANAKKAPSFANSRRALRRSRPHVSWASSYRR